MFQLSSRHLATITPGVTLLSKSSHACGRKSNYNVVLKSEKKTFYLAIPFSFNENAKCLVAHEKEIRCKRFNIRKFPLQ